MNLLTCKIKQKKNKMASIKIKFFDFVKVNTNYEEANSYKNILIHKI